MTERTLGPVRAVLKEASSKLSLPQLLLLLIIAEKPGLSVNELSELTSLSQPVASRTLGILMGRYEGSEGTSVQLVDQRINNQDPRRRALFLTEEGETLVKELEKIFREA